MKLRTYLISLLLISSNCFAKDHCKYLSVKHVSELFNELAQFKASKSIPVLDYYCRPCNDTYVRPIVVQELEYKTHDVKGFASILINGKEYDFAYLFLNGQNLGHKYQCKTEVSSKTLFPTQEKS